MQRFLTILEGQDQGKQQPLLDGRMLVGRSGDADIRIQDPKVSSAHLDLRVQQDAIFVQNVSRYGSLLNDKPLTAEVSLNPGDILVIGSTKLRYDEAPDAPAPLPKPPDAEPVVVDPDATRLADPNFMADQERARQKEEAPDEESTRAVVEDGTRIANPSELPGWKPPQKEAEKESISHSWVWLVIVTILAVLGVTFWILRGPANATTVSRTEFNDPLFGFSVLYPSDWSKSQETAEVTGFVAGKAGDNGAQVNIYHDKSPEYALTGLSDGFVQYEDILKKDHFKDFELTKFESTQNNDVTRIHFLFHSPSRQGLGIYVLNADTRIVVECSSPLATYQEYNQIFNSILKSFRFNEGATQQFIEFPLPDAATRAVADSDPTELGREFNDHLKRADGLLTSKDVKPDNLYLATQEYRRALQLAASSSQRLSDFPTAAKGLLQSTSLYNQALAEERFKIKLALKVGDPSQAYWEANKMMQMVPEKTDSAYQEAYALVRSLERYRK